MKLVPRMSALTILTAHGVGALAWLWFMPGGFPIIHSRFWTNQVGPIVVLALVVVAVIARARQRLALFGLLALAVPFAWLGAAISGITCFPISARLLTPIALIAAVLMAMSLRAFAKRSAALYAIVLAGIALGATFPILERAAPPRTIPADVSIASPPADAAAQGYVQSIQLRPDIRVAASSGQVSLNVGRVHIEVSPLMSFISRSPDRCWTIFSPRAQRIGPGRELIALQRAADQSTLDLWYRCDDVAHLAVDASSADRIELDAKARLTAAIYSHLNSYADIAIVGHRRLRVSFSPCPDVRIDVKYANYPFGAPIRFAYFDASEERLRIVEASDAEKGPFRELASGPIRRGEPLTITLFDEGTRVAAITLHDFTSQASDELSPTAGWRVQANSIAFSLSDENPRAPAAILISLADTGIGRGYDTVGHAAGVYRNRMTIERSPR